jgi:cytoskeletal protein RodZ|uniref:DUF1049 domain-containing protein n=1 Tax=Caldisericum exile TaxID=693075 RepID=A0A7C4XYQ6_9BACT
MKKVGMLLLILLLLTGLLTWFLLLNINNFASINLFGYKINDISTGALVLIAFILGGIIIWFISFISYTIEIQQLKSKMQKEKSEKEKQPVKDEEKQN